MISSFYSENFDMTVLVFCSSHVWEDTCRSNDKRELYVSNLKWPYFFMITHTYFFIIHTNFYTTWGLFMASDLVWSCHQTKLDQKPWTMLIISRKSTVILSFIKLSLFVLPVSRACWGLMWSTWFKFPLGIANLFWNKDFFVVSFLVNSLVNFNCLS